jgi:hypothetical protein
MWLIERKFHVILSSLLILIAIFLVLSFVLEAIWKIAGVYPAFLRPRKSFVLILFELAALLIKMVGSVWKL